MDGQDLLFHSQNLRRHISDLGVDGLAVGPGTKIKQTKKMMTAGATSATTASNHVGMVSGSVCGKEMDRSSSEKGRWYGLISFQPAPTAAMPLFGDTLDWGASAAGSGSLVRT